MLGSSLTALKATVETGLGDLVTPRPENPLDERDPAFIDATLEAYDAMARIYFRPDVQGLEHIPAEGPVLLVGDDGPIAIAEPREGGVLKPTVGFRAG